MMPSLRLPLLSRSLLTTLPAALALLGLVLLLAVTGQLPTSPAPVQAQSPAQDPVVLLSNLGQHENTTSTGGYTQAQQFITGNTPSTLTSISVRVGRLGTSQQQQTIRGELWSTVGSHPGTKLADLTFSSAQSSGTTAVFTAPAGTGLAPNTAYNFVLYTTGSFNLEPHIRTWRGEDTYVERIRNWRLHFKVFWTTGNNPTSSSSWSTDPAGPLVIQVRGVLPSGDGTLDYAFAESGQASLDLHNVFPDFEGRAMAVQSDGKFVVAGDSGGDFAVVRFNADGSLDADFGAGGIAITVSSSGIDDAEAVAIAADGSIVVAGSSWNGSNWDFAVIVYDSDGELETDFSTDGIATTEIGSAGDFGRAVAVQSDGKIVVAGNSYNGADHDFAVVRYNADGSLDTGFGITSSGKITTAVGSGNDHGRAVAIDGNGKIVVAGESHNGSDMDFGVVRYNANGSLDTGFGTSTTGKIRIPVSSSGDDSGQALALDGDGNIVVAGYGTDSNVDFAVVRFDTDGSLDTDFSTDGKVLTTIGPSNDFGRAVAIDGNGKIVVAGHRYGTGVNKHDFALVRYNADGSLDTGFSADGKQITVMSSGNNQAHAVAVQSDNKIVAAGYARNAIEVGAALARYNTNGNLDTGFDGDGKATSFDSREDEARAVALQPDGKIVMAGSSNNGSNDDFAVVRYNADGGLDTDFGEDGRATTEIGSAGDFGRAVGVQADGKIVVAGNSYNGSNHDFALVSYNADGTLDTGFGTGGKVTTGVGSGDDYGRAVAVQSDGKIVVAGESHNGSDWDFAVVRYNADGTLDTGFGTGGKVTTGVGSAGDFGQALALQADGKIVVAGYSYNGSDQDFAVARYNTDGSLDTGFDSDGLAITTVGTADDFGRAVAIAADGKIVVVGESDSGSSNWDVAVARYSADGSLDTGFDSDGMATTSVGSAGDFGRAAAVDKYGKIVVAGNSYNGSNHDFVVLRYDTDGSLDDGFGFDHDADNTPDGYNLLPFGPGNDVAQALALERGGKIVVAGYRENGLNKDFALARFHVTRSENADLSDLTVSTSTDNSDFTGSLTLDPTFAAGTTSYRAVVAHAVTHVKLTPTVDDTGKATLRLGVDDRLAPATDAEASDAIALDVGENVLTVEVTAENATIKTYTVRIFRHSDGMLVSNFGEPRAPGVASTRNNRAWAQGFTTGADTDGYPLGGISVRLLASPTSAQRDTIRAELWSWDNGPDDKVYDLTVPDHPITTGVVRFTAPPDTVLDDNTSYFFVVYTAGSYGMELAYTASDDEDSDSASGWNIFDRIHLASSASGLDASTSWTHQNTVKLSIVVDGDSVGPTDLSGLTAESSADGSTFTDLTLSPAFSAGTTAYTAIVAEEVTEARLTPTLADTSSSVQVGLAGQTLGPVVSGAASPSIELEIGDNPITVEVTASDSTTKEYTVNVRRRDVWSATLTPAEFTVTGSLTGIGCHEDHDTCDSQLTDSEFSVGGQTYSFELIADWDNSANYFQVKTEPKAEAALQDLKFCVGGTGGYSITGGENEVGFGGTDHGWAEGVPVKLSIGTSCEQLNTYGFSPRTHTGEPGATLDATVSLSEAAPAGGLTLTLTQLFGTDLPASLCATTTQIALAESDDVASMPTSVTVPAGDTEAKFSYTFADNGDDLVDGVECFGLRLDTTAEGWVPEGSSVGKFSIQRTRSRIAMGNSAGATTAYTQTVAENASGGTFSVPLTIAHLPYKDVAFYVEVLSTGSATTTDFSLSSDETVWFGPASSTTQNLEFTLIDDTEVEGDETIDLRILDGAVASLNWAYRRHAQGKLATITIQSEDAVPGAPTDLRISSADTKLDVSWKAPADAGSSALTGYDLHYTSADAATVADGADVQTGTAAVGWVDVGHTGTTTLSDEIGSLTNGTEYRVRVRAVNAIGGGVWEHGKGTPSAKPSVSLSASPNPVNEGSSVTVTATLSAALTANVTIPLTLTAGTAESGDYGTLANITVSSGAMTGTGTISANHDSDADDETFTVAMDTANLPSSVVAGSPSSVAVTITDDEKPTVSLSASPNPVTEGSSVTITATLTAALSSDVAIPVTVTDGTAEPADHGNLTSITVSAGSTTGTGTITTAQDSGDSDETFTVSLDTANLPAAVLEGSPNSVLVTIADDEGIPSVSLSASPNPVDEGSSVTVTATLSKTLTANVTIPLTLTAGTAESGDYGTLASITVSSGATTGTGTISANQDSDADDETFTVALDTANLPSSVVAGSPSSVVVTITDDEKPTVSLSASPNPVTEGSAVTITATLAASLSSDVAIPLTLTAGTAETGDYGTLASITVSAGQTTGTGEIATNHDSGEDDETFTVALDTANLPSEVLEGSPNSVLVTISDDEGIPSVSLSASPNPVDEGSSVTVTATLSKTLTSSVTIPLTLTAGTAESGDYGTLASITVSSGQTTGTGAIRTNQDRDTDDETFTVSLGTLPSEVRAGSASSVLVTITDDDKAEVSLEASPNPVDEGNAVTITARLSKALPEAVTIPIGLAAFTAEDGDYGTLESITVVAGRTSGTGTITTVRDEDEDDDGFTVTVVDPIPSSLLLGYPFYLDITIRDDGPLRLELASSALRPGEGGSARLTATLNHPAPVGGARVRFGADGRGDSPASPLGDFTLEPAGEGQHDSEWTVIAEGERRATATLRVVNDTEPEDDETLVVWVRGDWTDDVPELELTIPANDGGGSGPAAWIDAEPNPVDEGRDVTVRVRLTEALGAEATIPLTLSRGTAEAGDYGTLASITIASGATVGTGVIATARDADGEDETFTVRLGRMPSGVRAGTASSVVVTIDDLDGPRAWLEVEPNPVAEGSAITVTAKLEEALSRSVTIPVTVERVTSESGDHGTLAGIVIASGRTEGSGRIATRRDTDGDDETFTVSLGTLPSGVRAGHPESVEVVIADEGADGPAVGVSLSASPNPVAEGESVTVTATLTEALTRSVTIPVSVSAGTAESGDHGSLAGIRIASGATSGTGAISTRADSDTGDETFTVSLGSSLPSGILASSPSSVTVTIADSGGEAPGRVRSLRVSAGDGRLDLAWSAPSSGAVTAYETQYRERGASGWTTLYESDYSDTAAAIVGLVNGTRYDVRVRASNDHGEGAWATSSGTPASGGNNSNGLRGLSVRVSDSPDGAYRALSLRPSFSSSVTAYTATAPAGTTHARVRVSASSPTALILVDGHEVASGSESPAVHVSSGAPVWIAVIPADNGEAKEYSITITIP